MFGSNFLWPKTLLRRKATVQTKKSINALDLKLKLGKFKYCTCLMKISKHYSRNLMFNVAPSYKSLTNSFKFDAIRLYNVIHDLTLASTLIWVSTTSKLLIKFNIDLLRVFTTRHAPSIS